MSNSRFTNTPALYMWDDGSIPPSNSKHILVWQHKLLDILKNYHGHGRSYDFWNGFCSVTNAKTYYLYIRVLQHVCWPSSSDLASIKYGQNINNIQTQQKVRKKYSIEHMKPRNLIQIWVWISCNQVKNWMEQYTAA